MGGCSIFGCKSNTHRKEAGVTFHAFPTNKETRNQWLARTGKQNWVPKKYSRVCSKHFEENCFCSTHKKTLIKKSAIPTLFLRDSSGNDSTVSDNTLSNDVNHLHITSAIQNIHENPLDGAIKLESNSDVPTNSEVPFLEDGFVVSSLIGRPEVRDVIKIEDNQDGSNNLEVCRVCLAADRKMFELKNRTLKQAYTQLTGFSVSSHDGLPQMLCWECTSRVLCAVKLYDRAKKAHTILSALLAKGSMNMKDIRSVNRKQMNLMTSLSCEYFKHTQYHDIIEGDIIENKQSDNFDNSTEMYLNIGDIGHETEDVDDQDDKYKSEIDEHDNDVKTDLNDQDDIMKDKDVDSTKDMKESNAILKEPKRIRQRKLKSDSKNRGKTGISKLQEFFTITALKLEDAVAAVQSRKHSEAYMSGLFKCELCYRGYSTRSNYEVHALKHTEKFGNIECPVCKFRYKRTQALTCHMLARHRKKYRCKQCDFVTNARTTADNHRKFHAGDIFKCPHCSKQFNQKTSYYSHMRVKHACSFACEMCGHTFLSASGVAQHKRMRHVLGDLSIEGPFCETCDVTFATREAYDTHLLMSSRHNNDNLRNITNAYQPTPRDLDADGRTRRRRPARRRVTCEQCGVTLDSVQSYAHHFRRLHPAETRAQHVGLRRGAPAVCELCGKTFHCMATLKSHMSVHTGVGFKCDDCGKTFMGKFNLYLHRKLHEPSRPTYPCEVCGKRFSNSGNLKRHVRSHTDATPFECEACGKRLTTRAGLQAHIDHVHSGRPWPKRARPRRRP